MKEQLGSFKVHNRVFAKLHTYILTLWKIMTQGKKRYYVEFIIIINF